VTGFILPKDPLGVETSGELVIAELRKFSTNKEARQSREHLVYLSKGRRPLLEVKGSTCAL
jgi:hypothetical protein